MSTHNEIAPSASQSPARQEDGALRRRLMGWLALLPVLPAADLPADAGATATTDCTTDTKPAAALPCAASADVAGTIRWYSEAAMQGDPSAMRSMGFLQETGLGMDRDVGGAIRWYREAAAAGDSGAMSSLGRCYEEGLGVKADPREAVRWYRMAASCGDREARQALARLGV
jgi:hypothetical protein